MNTKQWTAIYRYVSRSISMWKKLSSRFQCSNSIRATIDNVKAKIQDGNAKYCSIAALGFLFLISNFIYHLQNILNLLILIITLKSSKIFKL